MIFWGRGKKKQMNMTLQRILLTLVAVIYNSQVQAIIKILESLYLPRVSGIAVQFLNVFSDNIIGETECEKFSSYLSFLNKKKSCIMKLASPRKLSKAQ